MLDKPFHKDDTKIALAVLRLAAQKTWPKVTIALVAAATKLSRATLERRFKNALDLVPIVGHYIDYEAFKTIRPTDGTNHDRLFDLFMARFDVMQKHRAALISMADAAARDRQLGCILARSTLDMVYHILEYAELKAPRLVAAAGIAVLYVWVFLIWKTDMSTDMGKTMAALDKGLRIASRASSLVNAARHRT